ncbi:alpha/beta hydrolase [Streptomyces canus]|uniref:alpha/beta hydrolase n=1 Tax=Streptomyces canus TaxID=58343 RepID=UPI003247C862
MRRTLAAAAAVVVAASSVVVAEMSPAAARDALRWKPCAAAVGAPGLECSTLRVPLDYRRPEGREIEIAISRLKSKNPSQRRGVLLTNPGGPGGPGLDYPALLTDPTVPHPLPQSVRDRYDVIGLDPRGVGLSSPVTCDVTPEQLAPRWLPYPQSPGEVVRHAGVARTVSRQCATSETQDLLPHITTANTARDMDRIREALGEPKISYLGGSYGSYLGAAYATLFPLRGDRIVLDSVLGAGGYDHKAQLRFAIGFDDRFPDFAKFVVANPQYGLGTTPAQVRAKYLNLAARLDRKPIGGVDGSLLRNLTHEALYADVLFPGLAEKMKALHASQPVQVTPPAGDMDNFYASHFYVLCGDSSWPRSVRTYQRQVATHRAKHPLFGAAAANVNPCAFWRKPVEPPVRIHDRGPSNVLLVQNLRDPGTPLVGALELRRAFGNRARLVTADQGGHGAYGLFAENMCANNTVTAFLTTGERPERDRACTAES